MEQSKEGFCLSRTWVGGADYLESLKQALGAGPILVWNGKAL